MSPTNTFDICCFSQNNDALIILDQTLLPNEERFISLRTAEEVSEAIRKLRVRGAPLIGVAAAMGLYIAVQNEHTATKHEFLKSLHDAKQLIIGTRPTAINLAWALNRIEKKILSSSTNSVETLLQLMRDEAVAIKEETAVTCTAIGAYGNTLLTDKMGILTHCNAGELATGFYGTALAPIYYAQQQNKHLKVYADETRPLLQGARLTAYELCRHGVDTTLICDNMVATIMSQNKVQMVLVGCDRVAANGDTANKIGTLGVAILAHHFGIPFYVCGPSSSFDFLCPSGGHIIIEEREESEIKDLWYRQPMAPAECHVFNPAFDITPHNLITAYITEKNILKSDELHLLKTT